MKLNFLVLLFCVIGHSAFAAAATGGEFSIHEIDKWHIHSPGYSILWGKHKRGRFVASMDSLRGESKLHILEGSDEAFSRQAKELFDKFQAETGGPVQAVEARKFVEALNSLEKPSAPITDDSELITSMVTAPGLIWTGAGISLASGVPTLPSLYKSLGLTYIPYTFMAEEEGLRAMTMSTKGIQELLFGFLDGVRGAKALGLKPSAAHYAIKKILGVTGAQYITSNLDRLEEDAGYGETVQWDVGASIADMPANPLTIKSSNAPFLPKWLLMVGLSGDDYGIAGWAVDNAIPIYYMGPNAPETVNLHNFRSLEALERIKVQWIKADAQIYLPELYAKIWALQNPGDIPSHSLHLYGF